MNGATESLAELNEKAYAILLRELGPVEALRFFSQINAYRGNYVEERRVMFQSTTVDDIRAGIDQLNHDADN